MLAIVFAHNGSEVFVASREVDRRMADTPSFLFAYMAKEFKLPDDDIARILCVRGDETGPYVYRDLNCSDWEGN